MGIIQLSALRPLVRRSGTPRVADRADTVCGDRATRRNHGVGVIERIARKGRVGVGEPVIRPSVKSIIVLFLQGLVHVVIDEPIGQGLDSG